MAFAVGVKNIKLRQVEQKELPEIENNDQSFVELTEILVDPGQEQIRVDKYLMSKISSVTRTKIQNTAKAGSILVNGKQVKPNHKVKPNDKIEVFLVKQPENETLIAEDIPLDIVYEDDHVLVINKQAGLVVHPGIGNPNGTLVNALKFYFKDTDLPVLDGNMENRIGLVHRIDKDTSGLMVIAKTEFAMAHLGKQFFDHSIKRTYTSLVWGSPEPEKGSIETHIGRHPQHRILRFAYPDGEEGKWAKTHYKVVLDMYYVSVVECTLETGRTHQIRVHMQYLGHPLFNDHRYGGDAIRKGTVFNKYKQFVQNCFEECPRHALHASELGFVHPETGEELFFKSEMPADMKSCVDKWYNYVDTKRTKTDGK